MKRSSDFESPTQKRQRNESPRNKRKFESDDEDDEARLKRLKPGSAKYRNALLEVGVKIVDIPDLDEEKYQGFLPDTLAAQELLETDLDRSVQIPESLMDDVLALGGRIRYQENGYQNGKIVEEAVDLLTQVKPVFNGGEAEWAQFFDIRLWTTADLKSKFSFS